jgi:pyrimidine operon attenuation protein/uracil phosphoribosyltransferase
MSAENNIILMDTDRIRRSLKRMAHEIAERNDSDRPILLFGIDNRGYAVSSTLAQILGPMFKDKVRSVQLPLKNGNGEKAFKDIKKEESQNKFLLAVDDVIFSGRTMFTALKTISEKLDPSEIHTAVMIDRGHRKYPVKAEFSGMELPTKLNEHVSVIVEGMEIQKVVLSKKTE